jgi:hypothetical protein
MQTIKCASCELYGFLVSLIYWQEIELLATPKPKPVQHVTAGATVTNEMALASAVCGSSSYCDIEDICHDEMTVIRRC